MSKSETAFRPHYEISHRYDTVMLSVLVSLLCFFFFFLSFGTNHAVIFWCGQTKMVTVPNMKFLLCDSFKITENVAQQYCQC